MLPTRRALAAGRNRCSARRRRDLGTPSRHIPSARRNPRFACRSCGGSRGDRLRNRTNYREDRRDNGWPRFSAIDARRRSRTMAGQPCA
jgi:hypothetical protein